MKKKYTQKDLDDIISQYDINFEKLLKVKLFTPEHDKLLAIENALYKKEVEIRKELNLMLYDPCPLNIVLYCSECTGYYEVLKNNRLTKVTNKKADSVIMVKSDEGGILCPLKQIKASEEDEEWAEMLKSKLMLM